MPDPHSDLFRVFIKLKAVPKQVIALLEFFVMSGDLDKNNHKPSGESISVGTKVVCWSAAWVVVILATLVTNPGGLRYAFFFPMGWSAFLQTSDLQKALLGLTGWWVIGWCFYVALTFVLFVIRNRYLYFTVFLIFCLLLALNAVGCKHLLDTHQAIAH